MKKYLIFFGDVYYPSGGMDDFIADSDSYEECLRVIKEKVIKEFDGGYMEGSTEYLDYIKRYQWCHIYDTVLREEIWQLNELQF